MVLKNRLGKNITRYELPFTKYEQNEGTIQLLEDVSETVNLGTYGGVNTDILFESFSEKGYDIRREEICPTADDDIGLRMPNFWVINQGPSVMSIATYYNWMQMKETLKKSSIEEWNPEVRSSFGWLGMVEVFDTSELRKRLEAERYPYFSVPFTLTECVRYLEGHDSERLKIYAGFAEEIRQWSQKQIVYNPEEWGLGKEGSLTLQQRKGLPTNVKQCVRAFWENELLGKRYSRKDRELNVVSREFSGKRDPKVVLLGESFLGSQGFSTDYDLDKHNLIYSPSRSSGKMVPLPILKNPDKAVQLRNALLLNEKYPEAKIILLSHSPEDKIPFKLADSQLKKEDANLESMLGLWAYLDSIGAEESSRKIWGEIYG
jgi:hypothetical protein